MSFSMMGTRGQVRIRITPKGYGRGPRGVVGKHDRNAYKKAVLNAKTPVFSTPEKKSGLFNKVASGVRNLFRRGAK